MNNGTMSAWTRQDEREHHRAERIARSAARRARWKRWVYERLFGETPTPTPAYAGMIVARVQTGPFTLVVAGHTYEEIIEKAEEYVWRVDGKHYMRTMYTDLSMLLDGGVVGALDDVNHPAFGGERS